MEKEQLAFNFWYCAS